MPLAGPGMLPSRVASTICLNGKHAIETADNRGNEFSLLSGQERYSKQPPHLPVSKKNHTTGVNSHVLFEHAV
jgi:hypothetical protein